MPVKIAGELLDRGVHRGEQVVVRAQLLAHRAAQPLVAGQAGARGQHLGGGAGGALGLALRSRRRRPATAASYAARAASASAYPPSPKRGDRVGRDLAAGDQRRAVGDARDDRRAAQESGSGDVDVRICGDHGHKLTPRRP